MVLIDIIKHRRSVRKYFNKPVERNLIMTCLEAARLAPSACNSQPWKFIVVDDKELKNELCEAAFQGIYKMMAFCKTAPVIIAIVSEKSKFWARVSQQTVEEAQTTLRNGDCGQRYTSDGLLFVQLFIPRSDSKGMEKGRKLAIVARDSYRGVTTPGKVWFRNQRIKELRDYFTNRVLNEIEDSKLNGHPTDRLVNTSDADFYKWDQWIFLQMLKRGIPALTTEVQAAEVVICQIRRHLR